MFDNETNDYALSDCVWWDVSVTKRPFWAKGDCAGRVGDTEHGIMCETHYNAIPKEGTEHVTLKTGTEYVTEIDGETVYRGSDLSVAIREWDAMSFQKKTHGGVTVQTWEDGTMVRDGWILHVFESGQVYLNPNLR